MAVFYMHVRIFFWLLIKRRGHLQAYLFTGGVVLAGYFPWVGMFIRQIDVCGSRRRTPLIFGFGIDGCEATPMRGRDNSS
jgi:hypothetical protein